MFESNILNIYGDKGKAWLQQLPKLVSDASLKFLLRDLKPVPNLTYNYVISGFQGDIPVILKLGLDHEGLAREAFALKCFAGYGTVKLISEKPGLMLLERADPGISLKNYFPDKDIEAIQITCNLMKNLASACIPADHNFPHIKDWLSALDKDSNIPAIYLQKARVLRDQLLKTSSPDVLIHGDLHHDNILQNGDDWLVIDPKGVIGEPAYEAAAFIRNPIPDLLTAQNAAQIIQKRIEAFALSVNVPPTRIADWCFVQSVLAWIWALEDGCDAGYWDRMMRVFDEFL